MTPTRGSILGPVSASTVSTPSTPVYLQRLEDIFKSTSSKHDAHTLSAPVLKELAHDDAFLTEALRRQIGSPDGLNVRHYPVLALPVASNPYFDLVINCWIPLPTRETDLSTKAIHHHGELLLTTATAFGPGYEHWTFELPRLIDEKRGLYTTRLIERDQARRGEAAFVDAYKAHVPMYPASLTITICLWSRRSAKTWKDDVKRIPALQRNAAKLRRAAGRLGLGRTLDLNMVDTFDFHPSEEGFVGQPERDEFGRGPNSDYLFSLFHVLQETNNEGLAGDVEKRLAQGGVEDPALVRELLARLTAGEPIEGRLSEGHYGVPHANFRSTDIEQALAATAS